VPQLLLKLRSSHVGAVKCSVDVKWTLGFNCQMRYSVEALRGRVSEGAVSLFLLPLRYHRFKTHLML
jgi:hypothetical protein